MASLYDRTCLHCSSAPAPLGAHTFPVKTKTMHVWSSTPETTLQISSACQTGSQVKCLLDFQNKTPYLQWVTFNCPGGTDTFKIYLCEKKINPMDNCSVNSPFDWKKIIIIAHTHKSKQRQKEQMFPLDGGWWFVAHFLHYKVVKSHNWTWVSSLPPHLDCLCNSQPMGNPSQPLTYGSSNFFI